jgi:hypothetical protein
MNQFAKCLRDKFGQQHVPAPPLVPDTATPMPPRMPPSAEALPPLPVAPAQPISGFALMARVIWAKIAGLFRRS